MTQRVLWRPHIESQTNGHNIVDRKRQRIEEEIDFYRIRGLRFSDILKDKSNSGYYDKENPSLVITTPPQSSLSELISEHVMIVEQKIALNLTLFLLLRELIIMLLPQTSTFISNVVTLISFISLRRNRIVHHYTSSMFEGSFTITVVLSLIVLTQVSTFERVIFGTIMLVVCILSPCIQWRLQRHKRIISGPWNISHISS